MVYLHIGLKIFEFKKQNSSIPIFRLQKKEEIIDWIDTYRELQTTQSVAIEDLSYMALEDQTLFFQFLDTTQMEIHFLSRFDCILPSLFSRCDRVYKKSIQVKRDARSVEETFSNFRGARNQQEKWKILSEQSPLLSYYIHSYPHFTYKTIQLIV